MKGDTKKNVRQTNEIRKRKKTPATTKQSNKNNDHSLQQVFDELQ